MATQTYLMNRNGIYYARIPVPLDLQKRVGRKEIWKSLGNRNYKDACTLLKSVLLSDVLLMVPQKEVLSSKPAMIAIGERQREVARHRLCHLYLTTHQNYSKGGIEEERDEDVGLFINDAKEELANFYDDLKLGRFRSYEETLNTRLQTTKFQAPERSSIHYLPAMTQLVRGLIRGTEEALKGIESGAYIDFVDGVVTPYPDSMLETKSRSSLATHAKANASEDVITLKQLAQHFNNSQEIQSRSPEVKAKYTTYQALLCEAIGEGTDIKSITRPLIREKLIPILKHLPANFQKKPEYKGMSATQVAIAEQGNPLFVGTVNNLYGQNVMQEHMRETEARISTGELTFKSSEELDQYLVKQRNDLLALYPDNKFISTGYDKQFNAYRSQVKGR